MPVRSYNINSTLEGSPFRKASYFMSWSNSSRVNGKLVLTPHTLDHTRDHVISARWMAGGGVYYPPPQANLEDRSPPGFSWNALDNQVYARFQGKLRKGSASMGVTLASWKQSRDMIVQRSQHAGRAVDRAFNRLTSDPRLLKQIRREREPLANQILETEFGWRPLVADVQAALTTVCKDGVPPEWITARGRERILAQRKESGSITTTRTWDGFATTSYSAKVSISNPNLWLLNRMGLINPGTVAWDLIPWSFVVNWFVNVNSMVSSVSDEVGLDVGGQSVTRTKKLIFETVATSQSPLGFNSSRILNIRKTRSVFTSLQPHWEVKVPDLNWELALIATSLVVQKIKKLNNLIRLF